LESEEIKKAPPQVGNEFQEINMTRYRLLTQLATALGIMSAFMLVGCPQPPPPSESNPGVQPDTKTAKTTTIGTSLLTMQNPFFKDIADSMTAEGAKNGYTVNIQAGELDPARQKDQVNDFIVKKVNAIVLSPVDSHAIGSAIQAANAANIPVFTADIACLDANAKVVSHIATDNLGGGKLAGEAMVKALEGKGKVAIISHPEVESVIQRAKGFKEVIAKSPGIQIVSELPGKGQRDTSFKVAQDILQAHPDVVGIFAINDPSALGAVAAIEKAGKSGKVKVIGFDGMKEARQAVKEGKIYADIVQHPEKIGQLTIQTILKYMSGEKVEPVILLPATTYIKEDADKDDTLK
jgi:ribose transport system substrate-binding protein